MTISRNFTKGDPVAFLQNINNHMPTHDESELVFIERTGHTYQMKEQEVADTLLSVVSRWKEECDAVRGDKGE